jgi:hypothetical protein
MPIDPEFPGEALGRMKIKGSVIRRSRKNNAFPRLNNIKIGTSFCNLRSSYLAPKSNSAEFKRVQVFPLCNKRGNSAPPQIDIFCISLQVRNGGFKIEADSEQRLTLQQVIRQLSRSVLLVTLINRAWRPSKSIPRNYFHASLLGTYDSSPM